VQHGIQPLPGPPAFNRVVPYQDDAHAFELRLNLISELVLVHRGLGWDARGTKRSKQLREPARAWIGPIAHCSIAGIEDRQAWSSYVATVVPIYCVGHHGFIATTHFAVPLCTLALRRLTKTELNDARPSPRCGTSSGQTVVG
jgi:hypothetical protein